MREEFEQIFGVKLAVAVFGFCGGVLSLAYIKTLTVGWAFFAIIAGFLCSIVFTPMVQSFMHFQQPFENGVAFILGIAGLSLVGKIHDIVIRADIRATMSKMLARLEETKGDEK